MRHMATQSAASTITAFAGPAPAGPAPAGPAPAGDAVSSILGMHVDIITAISTAVMALATVLFTYAALRQLPLLAGQLRALSQQLKQASDAETSARDAAAAELERHNKADLAARKEAALQLEWQNRQYGAAQERFIAGNTLRVCERYVSDAVIHAATKRIWEASKSGTHYDKSNINDHDIITALNYLDGIAVGVQQGVFSGRIVKDHMEGTFNKIVDTIIPAIFGNYKDYEAIVWLRNTWRDPLRISYEFNADQGSGS